MGIHRMFLPVDMEGEANCGIVTASREDVSFVYIVYSHQDVYNLCDWYSEDISKEEAIAVEAALDDMERSSLPQDNLRKMIVVNDTAANMYETLLTPFTDPMQAHAQVLEAGLDLDDNLVLQFSTMDTPDAAELPYGTCEFQFEGEPCTVIFYGLDQGLCLITELAWMDRIDSSFVQNAARALARSLLPANAPRDMIRIEGFAAFVINLAYKKLLLDNFEDLEASDTFAANTDEYVN